MKPRTIIALILGSALSARGQEPNTSAGALRVNGYDSTAYPLTVPLNVNTITIQVSGNPGLPLILADGPRNPGTVLTTGGQRLDIGTPSLYSDIHYLVNGVAPVSLFDLLGNTNATGQMTLTINTDVSVLPAGAITTLQAMLLDPSAADGFELTAATTITGPTVLCGTPIANVGDDSAHPVILQNFAFPFYGQAHTVAYVGSNGFLTFGSGSTDFTETNAELTGLQPRIAPLWNDWSPNQGGTVSVYQDWQTVRVCWNGVRSYGGTDWNSFRMTLHPDGTIQFAYDAIAMQGSLFDGITGISAGGAQGGNLSPMDLSASVGTGSIATATRDPRFENFAQSVAGFDLLATGISFSPTSATGTPDGPYLVW